MLLSTASHRKRFFVGSGQGGLSIPEGLKGAHPMQDTMELSSEENTRVLQIYPCQASTLRHL